MLWLRPVNSRAGHQARKQKMKALLRKVIRAMKPTTYYYHEQVLTDDLEREMMKAYMGTGVRGRHF